MILLGESLDCHKSLHLSFQGAWGVSGLLVYGSHWSCLGHATLCLKSGDIASLPQTAPTDDA